MPSLKPVTPAFVDDAPFRVVVEATVPAPISACWALLVDQTSWPLWFDAMSAVEATPPVWTKPGQTRNVTVNGLKVEEEAIAIDHEAEYAFMITKWPLPIASHAAEAVRLEERTIDGSPQTKLTYIGAFELTIFGKPIRSILTKQFTKSWEPALRQLGTAANQS